MGMAVSGLWLDSKISQVFSNLNDSMILRCNSALIYNASMV